MSLNNLVYGKDEHAELYVKFRPTYTEDIYRTIYEFCKKDKSFDCGLAVDVGCGSGQSTLPLCTKFRQVIGCDISPAQLKRARGGFENLEYKVGSAENMGFLKDSSVDLVTTGTALHWLDQEAFYSELRRVLKPGGVMAAYAYALPRISNDAADCVRQDFFDSIDSYWLKDHRSDHDLYKDVDIPFTEQYRMDQGELDMVITSSVDHFVGFMSSLQPYWDLCKDKPDNTLLEDTRNRLHNIYGDRDMPLRYPMCLLLGRKASMV